jgi:DNA-binding transcriptional LysR family regulator
VDFRHLRAFVTVADELSVTKAAERLHISQPPLSRQIHQLEDELGVSLFVRHRHGVTLTEPGRRLLEKARFLNAAAADFFDAAGQMINDDSRTIRIGIGWGLWEPVNRVRLELERQGQHTEIDVTDVSCADDYNAQLRNRSLDLVVSRPPFDTEALNVVPLFSERLLAVLSESHPYASRQSICIRELASEPLLLWDRHLMPVVYDTILEVYADAGVEAKMIPTPGAGPHNHASLMLVASGKGTYLCIGVPVGSQQPATGVALVPIADEGAATRVCVAWRKNETARSVLQFIECARKVVPQGHGAPVVAKTGSRRVS